MERGKKETEREAERFAGYRLHRTPYLGKQTLWKLQKTFGSAERVWNLSEKALEGVLCVRQLEEWKREQEKEKIRKQEWERLKERKIFFCSCFEECFPKRLRHIPDAPAFLYGKGNLPPETGPVVALIGARECSPYGKYCAAEYAAALARAGVPVISGMARGIDSVGQWAALEAGGTSVAVLGCGIDRCYPPEHRKLYDRLVQEGGIVSEYRPGVEAQAGLFPARNRIISGLADALLVVEAREESGTQITVDLALEQGKDIYALPGRSCDTLSRGCNRMIQQGAGMVLSPEELLEAVVGSRREREERSRENRHQAWGMEKEKEKEGVQTDPAAGAKALLAGILDYAPKSLTQIVMEIERRQGKPADLPLVTGQLMELVLEGKAVSERGCYRLRVPGKGNGQF